jgi:hypothetical protein
VRPYTEAATAKPRTAEPLSNFGNNERVVGFLCPVGTMRRGRVDAPERLGRVLCRLARPCPSQCWRRLLPDLCHSATLKGPRLPPDLLRRVLRFMTSFLTGIGGIARHETSWLQGLWGVPASPEGRAWHRVSRPLRASGPHTLLPRARAGLRA